jgi:nitroimidazol reductase NimA-like FMN-containing flavoprotein (pyridoxamine 5'-phosphate oxidase superfamily)
MAFREIRRRDRAVTEAEAREILARADHGVLATAGEDGWPYAVPLNHVLVGDVLYVHCALEGHKLENIAHHERVSYCAVASATVVGSIYSTVYESAIVFGRAALVTDGDEKRRALKLLTERFCGQGKEQAERFEKHLEQNENGSCTAVIRIQIERITGKARRATSA